MMRKTLEVINKLKKEGLIEDYAVGGAIGVLKWVEPFFTRDLDIFIVSVKDVKEKMILSPIYDFLKARGYNKWVEQWIIIEGVPVEFIPAEGLGKEAVETALITEFEEVETKVMIPEYLIALLLKALRDKDKRKIEMLLEQAEIDTERLNRILSKYGLNEKFKHFVKENSNIRKRNPSNAERR